MKINLEVYSGRLRFTRKRNDHCDVLWYSHFSALKAATPEADCAGCRTLGAQRLSTAMRYQIPLIIAALGFSAAVSAISIYYWMLYISELVAVNLRRQLMNKYLTLNLGFFQNFVRGSGGLISSHAQ